MDDQTRALHRIREIEQRLRGMGIPIEYREDCYNHGYFNLGGHTMVSSRDLHSRMIQYAEGCLAMAELLKGGEI